MNSIKVKSLPTPYNYNEDYLVIDGMSLPEWLESFALEQADEEIRKFGSLLGLYPAWGGDLDWKGDIRFVWTLIEKNEPTILPLLLCEDDLDFTCLVFVASVRKDEKYIYWDQLGYVLHENENFEHELKSGILCTDSYTEEDWEKYGDNIALEQVASTKWKEWIAENWDEELYRRRMNYTLPYYETEGNIKWIKIVNWIFLRQDYEKCISFYKNKRNSPRVRQ